LREQLPDRGFDLVNCAGVLYHVFSPLALLAAIRTTIAPPADVNDSHVLTLAGTS
jgi:hypothetical protein